MVQSSETREGFNLIPDVKWEDVGGLDLLRNEFDDYIIGPIKCPGDYEGFGLDLSTGFLLYGPPGCDKPLVAKAVANAAGVSFRHIKLDANFFVESFKHMSFFFTKRGGNRVAHE
ncbi:cell division control protein 48 homolog C [Cajanus cajan]|uniref:cell division control protein 48 homolog C n=1 Tax=Cajanus cajan TaxID=3821 RepID=UPI0010FAF718|nr:cell division control protein 48 homolog C [Cajanus cajan]